MINFADFSSQPHFAMLDISVMTRTACSPEEARDAVNLALLEWDDRQGGAPMRADIVAIHLAAVENVRNGRWARVNRLPREGL